MILEDDRITVYVGLNNVGEVVQYFANADEFENRNEDVVSIGFVEAIPLDYEEIFTIGADR